MNKLKLIPLTVLAASVLLLSGCSSSSPSSKKKEEEPMTRYCVDKDDNVVDESLCTSKNNVANGNSSMLPLYMLLFMRGSNAMPVGSHLTGGTKVAPTDTGTLNKMSGVRSNVSRGGLGSTGRTSGGSGS